MKKYASGQNPSLDTLGKIVGLPISKIACAL